MAVEDVLSTLILLAAVYGLYRYFSGPKPPSDPLAHVRREMVDAVTSAFPHVPPEAVVYSLSRTRSAQATSEIILERGGLPNPPTSFTIPAALLPPRAAPTTREPTSLALPGAAKPQSLIERYGLGQRLTPKVGIEADPAAGAGGDAAGPTAAGTGPGTGTGTGPMGTPGKWEATREERERELRTRKERMILEARRRMLEKQAKETKAE